MANILIGRSEKSHYRVSDPTVSRKHAAVAYLSKEDVRVTDLGSRNGTYILRSDGWHPIEEETAINRTDQLRFGKAKVFVADIIADAKLTNLPAATEETSHSSPQDGVIVPPKRELQRPRRNIFTGEVEEG